MEFAELPAKEVQVIPKDITAVFSETCMKIIIGIFQNKEDLASFKMQRMLDFTSLTEVGPFFSKNQALVWMKELNSRIDNSEIAFVPEHPANGLKWYGFTFEEQT